MATQEGQGVTDDAGDDSSGDVPVWARNVQRLSRGTGLTHSELARRAGMTRDAFHRYATGKTRPPVDRVHQLADLFGVDPMEIDPTRVYGQKQPRFVVGSAMTPYTLSAPTNGDPDLMHIKLEMNLRHMTMARVLEIIADERKWQHERDAR